MFRSLGVDREATVLWAKLCGELGRNIAAIDLFYLLSDGRRSSAASSKVAFPDLKKHVEKESLWKHKVVCNVKHRHENSRGGLLVLVCAP